MISIPLPSKSLELKVKIPRNSHYKLRHQDMSKAEAETETSSGLRGDLLIVFQTVILPATCITTYIIATSNNHVEKEFPYISDTGTWPPESCIFGILLCFYSLSTFLTVYIRWYVIQRHASDVSPRLNNVSLGLGVIASLGVLLVANFQETSQIIVHFVGAMMAFFIGGLYMWFQTVLSWKAPQIPGFFKHLLSIRLALTILTTLSAVLILPFAGAANSEYRGNETKTHTPGSGKWNSKLGGNEFHLASTSFEWALAGFVSLYFMTFIREFRHIRFGMPKIYLTQSSNQTAEYCEDAEKSRGVDNPAVDAR